MKSLTLIMAGVAAFADVSYTTTTQVTGGALVQMASLPMVGGKFKELLQPQTTQMYFKGDRLMNRGADSGSIIDVAAGTITQIDFQAGTYSVMTFAEFEAQVEKAMQELKQRSPDRKGPETKLDLDVKETGRKATIDGLACREVILSTTITATDPKTGQSGAMQTQNAMWLAKDVPGAGEMRAFWMKMAQKLKFDPQASRMEAMPGLGAGMSELLKQSRTLDGTAIVSTIVMGGTAADEQLSETTDAIRRADQESLAKAQAQGPSSKDVAGAATASAIGAAIPGLGGFGGFGRKKKAEQPAPSASPATPDSAVMKLRITEQGFSTSPVDGSLLEVPATFKKVAAK